MKIKYKAEIDGVELIENEIYCVTCINFGYNYLGKLTSFTDNHLILDCSDKFNSKEIIIKIDDIMCVNKINY